MKQGFFITLEGGEGGGKTTQSNRLCQWLRDQGHDVVQLRNPGTQAIRDILLRGETDRWTPLTEILLFNADRHELLETVIQPAIAAGKVVVCDRYCDSTYVYQGYGHGMPFDQLLAVQQVAIGDFLPDLTLIFDVDATTALARSEGKYKGEHRFEQLGEAYHTRIQHGFRQVAADNPRRCVLIDAMQPLDGVTDDMQQAVAERLSTRKVA